MNISAYHNSRISYYRLPQGALKCLEGAVLRIKLAGDGAAFSRVFLRLWKDDSESIIECTKKELGDEIIFSVNIAAPEKPQLIWYYFIIDINGQKFFYGARSGEGRLSSVIPPDYQITVYNADFETPNWFCEGIVYQIFPDRFFRGKPDLSGRTGLDRTEYHKKMGRPVLLHENWNEPVLYQPIGNEEFYSPCDFYGGDLNGIIEKLPYIASLGVSVIYLNPIFESASNHRYNTSDYLSIDPVLGTEYDLKELINAAGEHGISIMLDGVFSHTGDDSLYFNKYGNYSSLGAYQSHQSPYYEWYDFECFPDKYRCWWNFTTLPEVNELSPKYVSFIRSVLKKWTSLGIRGWRLDVADELPDEFISMLRSELKAIDHDGLLLGEVWEDASNKQWSKGLRKYVYGNELDSAMNYPFRDAVCDFFVGKIDAFALNEVLSGQRERYPEPFYRACMNILGTHDTQRILSVLSGAPPKDTLSRDAQAKYVYDQKRVEMGKLLLMAASALQYSMPQPPCVYYADEAGMLGLSDPFNRRTYPWDKVDEALIKHYKLLGKLRAENPALNRGKAAFLPYNEDVFCISRQYDSHSTLTIVNRSKNKQSIIISQSDFIEGADAEFIRFAENYKNALDENEHYFKFEASKNDVDAEIMLEPYTAIILTGVL